MENRPIDFEEHIGNDFFHPISLLLPDLVHPVNVGHLFRIADAFAVERVYLSGSTPMPPNRKIRKTSRATELYVPYSQVGNAVEVIEDLKRKGYRIICLERTTSSQDIQTVEVAASDKLCLVVGAETKGMAPHILQRANTTVHIPMYGRNSSMNVAVAASIAVYELLNKHRRVVQK